MICGTARAFAQERCATWPARAGCRLSSFLLDQVSHGRPVLVGLAKPMLGGRAAAHYEVVVGMNRERKLIRSLDPARGLRENTLEGFAREWVPTRQLTIIVLPPQAPTAAL